MASAYSLARKTISDADFLLIFSYDRPQNGNQILFFLGIRGESRDLSG